MVEIKSDFKICNEKKIKHINNFSLLWGDSLGELNFYMAMSDLVFMGDSLNNEGSHNIIEPFALEKPVLVGPSIWGIEYPALEALDVGILKKLVDKRASICSGFQLITIRKVTTLMKIRQKILKTFTRVIRELLTLYGSNVQQ